MNYNDNYWFYRDETYIIEKILEECPNYGIFK